jgi:hypothetical protein
MDIILKDIQASRRQIKGAVTDVRAQTNELQRIARENHGSRDSH